ncbi:hypothetical protein V3C99_000082 [Haemonchus contortus]|uniref:G_PROTEIN_RECEP_F1_2 domain-containing protein n=1 Tax=Haemonchus contortus TaxID=6289 RepID=A0A7I4YHP6_HAECO|nr:7TM GPCR domain containing protein [Haemonchus contortus]
MDPAFKCFSDDQLRLSGSQLETFLNTVVFPPLCAFGIVGNTLTIMVLISNDLMSRANIFLTCLAICDVCLLILMIPHSMAHFDYFAFRLFFRYPYLRSKIHLFALANWTSAVSIWLVVGVCFERVIGVRSPLHRLVVPSKRRLVAGLLLLLTACAALTCYNHVSQQCFMKVFCHETQWIAKCVDVTSNGWQSNSTNPSSQLLRQYVKWMRAANVALVVVIPLVFLVVLNSMLMYYVKKRSFFPHESLTKVTRRMQREGQAKLPFVTTLFRRHSDQLIQQKTEHRVAVTVCAVVTSFTITQAPSAVVLFWRTLWVDRQFEGEWYDLEVVTSFLVIFGKCLNFVVFCLSSDNFRQKLLFILRARCGGISEEKRCHSVITTYTRCDSRDSRILSTKKSFQSI